MKKTLVMLAAGLSRRFGEENKLLISVQGRPLFRHTLDKLIRLKDCETNLLVMTNTPEIQHCCRTLGVEWSPSPQASQGVSHTIRSALSKIEPDRTAVFFVADQPCLSLETIRKFLRQCDYAGKGLGCLSCAGVRGNPAWFAPEYRADLMRLDGDVGGRSILTRYPAVVLLCPASPEELEDVDLPRDLERQRPEV